MNNKFYSINLDIYNSIQSTDFEFVQGDVLSNELVISLFANGVPFNITNCTATITFCKSDKSVTIGTATITDYNNGILDYVVGTNDISIYGKVLATVEIFEGDKKLSSCQFSFNVRGNLDNGQAEPSGNVTDPYALKSLVDSAFNATTGHKHTGEVGDAPLIDANGYIEGGGIDLALNERITITTTIGEDLLVDRGIYYIYRQGELLGSSNGYDILIVGHETAAFYDRVKQIKITGSDNELIAIRQGISMYGGAYEWGEWSSIPTIIEDTKTVNSTGVAGQMAYDANYFYVCTVPVQNQPPIWIRFAKTAW